MDKQPVVRMAQASRPTPIYLLGDSHVLGFKNLFCRDSFTGGDYYTVVRYFSGLAGGSTFAGGTLSAPLVAALEYEDVLRDGRVAHLRTDELGLAVAYAGGVPQMAPLMLFTCGDIDLRANFLQYLKDDNDLILPFDDTYPATGRPPLPYDMALELVRSRLDPLIQALRWLHDRGLVRTYLHTIPPPTLNAELFRQMHGFTCPVQTRYKAARLYNHYLAEQCRQYQLPLVDIWPEVTEGGYLRPEYELDGVHLARPANLLSLRALLDHALNDTPAIRNVPRYRLLYEMATGRTDHVYDVSTGVSSYIELAQGPPPAQPAAAAPPPPPPDQPPSPTLRRRIKGLVRPLVPHRIRHLVRALAARPSVPPSSLASAPVTATAVLEGPARPTVQAPPRPAPGPLGVGPYPLEMLAEAAQQYRAEAVCTLALGPSALTAWADRLELPLEVWNRHARLDWAGNGLRPYCDYIRTCAPPQELLDDVRAYFGAERFARFFEACFGCPVQFLRCVPFLSVPHEDRGVGPQAWHHDGCPPGVFRAVLYLTDVDEDSGPFEYIADKQRRAVTGPAGTLLVFDANRLHHRGSPPKQRQRKVIDIVIAPRLAEQPFRVVWPGLNNWPADPFQYSVDGMRASPPFESGEVSFRPRRVA